MSEAAEPGPELRAWADNQRALARALGLSIDDWLRTLEIAAGRTMGLKAAVVGAATAKGLSLSVLEKLDPRALAERAKALIDPRPPRVESPLLKEAIRRAGELGVGGGAARLRAPRKRPERAEVKTPVREAKPLGESATIATADAPGPEQRGPKQEWTPAMARARARQERAAAEAKARRGRKAQDEDEEDE